MPDILEVLLHDKVIGTLTQLGGDRNIFAFTDSYINDPDRRTLSLSFKDAYGQLITDIRPTQTRVAPFFSNLLPEGPLREYLARRAGVHQTRDFYLLWALGQDLPGDMKIQPADGGAWFEEQPDRHETDDADHQQALRFSLAGVQLKFSAVMAASGGLTIPAEGIGGSWIIKLPSTTYQGVPENEFSMMTLARHVGIDVPEVQLHSLEYIAGLPDGIGKLSGQALAVKRFDRTSAGAVHVEDFAQVFQVYPERKYERASYRSIAKVVWIETGEQGLTEFIRRLVFNALIGNGDMHLKNWSFIYPDGHNAVIAPGYDFVSTIGFLADDKMALTLGHSKKWTDLSVEELQYFAARARLPEKLVLDTARETVERFNEAWAREKKHLPLTQHTMGIIESHSASIPLVSHTAKS